MSYRTEQKEKLVQFLRSNTEKQLPMQTIIKEMSEQGVGESTVYRLMKQLCDDGAVLRFVCGNNRRFFYQINRDEKCSHHIHLKCVLCGKLIHLNGFVSDFMVSQVAATQRFEIDEKMTLLYGKCAVCKGRVCT